jgi:hypothetical protein
MGEAIIIQMTPSKANKRVVGQNIPKAENPILIDSPLLNSFVEP